MTPKQTLVPAGADETMKVHLYEDGHVELEISMPPMDTDANGRGLIYRVSCEEARCIQLAAGGIAEAEMLNLCYQILRPMLAMAKALHATKWDVINLRPCKLGEKMAPLEAAITSTLE